MPGLLFSSSQQKASFASLCKKTGKAKAAAGQTTRWDRGSPHSLVMPGHQALASGTVLKSIECAHGKYGEEFLVSQAFIAQKEK